MWRPCSLSSVRFFPELAPSSTSEAKETSSDQELENMGAGEESDAEEVSWDGLLIEDENDAAMDC